MGSRPATSPNPRTDFDRAQRDALDRARQVIDQLRVVLDPVGDGVGRLPEGIVAVHVIDSPNRLVIDTDDGLMLQFGLVHAYDPRRNVDLFTTAGR